MLFEKFGEDLFYHLSNFLSIIDLISLSHTCNYIHTNCKPLVYPKFKRKIIEYIHRADKRSDMDIQTLLENLQNPVRTDIGIAGSFPLHMLLGNPKWGYNDIDIFHMKDKKWYDYDYDYNSYAKPSSSRYGFEHYRSYDFNIIFYELDCDRLNPTGIKENDTIVGTCFDKFDISVVKVVWSMDCLHISDVRDIYNRTMHVNFSLCRSTRADKYKSRGFKISAKDKKRIEWREHKCSILTLYRYKSIQTDSPIIDHILRSYGRGCRLYDNRFMYTTNHIKIPPLTDKFIKNLKYLFRNDIKSVKNINIQNYCRHLLQFNDHNQVTVRNTIKILIYLLKYEISHRDKLGSGLESDLESDYELTIDH